MNIKVIAFTVSKKSINTCMYVYHTVSFITIIVLSLLLRLPVNNSGMIMIRISNPQTETKRNQLYLHICLSYGVVYHNHCSASVAVVAEAVTAEEQWDNYDQYKQSPN